MRNAWIALAVAAITLTGCAAFAPNQSEPDQPSPAVVRLATIVAEAEQRVEGTHPGTPERDAAERNLDDSRAMLAVAIRADQYNRDIRDEAGEIDPSRAVEVGAGAIAPFLPPPWNAILLGVAGIAGTVGANRKGKQDGALEVARVIQQARVANPEFNAAFDNGAGEVMKAAPISESARRAIRKAKAGS